MEEYYLNLKEKIDNLKGKKTKRNEIIKILNISELDYTRSFRIAKEIQKYGEYYKLASLVSSFKSRNSNYPYVDFSYLDVMAKFGDKPQCYISKRDLDYIKVDFTLDHIVPASKGGSNELENLELIYWDINMFKSNYNIEELYEILIPKTQKMISYIINNKDSIRSRIKNNELF